VAFLTAPFFAGFFAAAFLAVFLTAAFAILMCPSKSNCLRDSLFADD
jgi:hypothetical protein